MNKTELIAVVAEKAGLTKADAGKAVNAFFDAVTETLAQGGSVQVIGFGNFEVSEYGERMGRNPRSGEAMVIPAGKRPKFVAGAALKKAVNG